MQLLAGTWLKWLHGFKLKAKKTSEAAEEEEENHRIFIDFYLRMCTLRRIISFSLFLHLRRRCCRRAHDYGLFYLFIWVRFGQLLRLTTSTMTSFGVSSIGNAGAGSSNGQMIFISFWFWRAAHTHTILSEIWFWVSFNLLCGLAIVARTADVHPFRWHNKTVHAIASQS